MNLTGVSCKFLHASLEANFENMFFFFQAHLKNPVLPGLPNMLGKLVEGIPQGYSAACKSLTEEKKIPVHQGMWATMSPDKCIP